MASDTLLVDAAEILPAVPRVVLADPYDRAEPGMANIRSGWIVLLLFFGAFLGFAAFCPMDAAVSADGVIKVSGERQTVQHRNGGTVQALYVREGQQVKAGEVLIQLAGAEVEANEKSLAAQVIDLTSERARLQSQLIGRTTMTRPPEFAVLPKEYQADAEASFQLQQKLLLANLHALGSQRQVIAQQSAQLGDKVSGLDRQMTSNRTQDSSYSGQLDGMRELAAQGYASANRVRELERARQGNEGDYARLSADKASARSQIGEMRYRSLSLDTDNRRQASDDLRKVIEQLDAVYPRWQDARAQVEALRIRAPATGQVVGLTVFTVGGVISAGEKLMYVVPNHASLVVEMRVSPNDAADLAVGQQAELKFPSFHERSMPRINGQVSRISADAFTDDKANTRYYTGEVTVSAADLEKLKQVKTSGSGLKAGLPVTVLVPLRKRTLLEYLLEPLNQALWRSGREH
ncbi:MAG TPA: HlyD family type I secretion periplasmic adaptor subunit [Novosphingobium sp.]|nr:HlyD family type I secretion periplasmic adaptor subunit [Novosphingobium sp.]